MKLMRIVLVLLSCLAFSCVPNHLSMNAKKSFKFSGGPAGGNFAILARIVSELANKEGFDLYPMSSKGSLENLRLVNSNQAAFSIVYASQLHSAINGKLVNDYRKYKNIRVLGYLFGFSAHLVVKNDSDIFCVSQLKDKKIGVGKEGSGTWYMAKEFFMHHRLWSDIKKKQVPTYQSAGSFFEKEIDAFWSFADPPDRHVVSASKLDEIRLIDLQTECNQNGFFEKHAYFTKTIIPTGIYKGIDHEIPSYQDSALLVANKNVPDHIVKQFLAIVYAPENINFLSAKKNLFRHMDKNNGNYGISLPMHKAAIAYYAVNEN